ncbi:MAG: argininosuccinate synthase [Planctomycetota bacterium]
MKKTTQRKTIVIAFSGGLDTSFCVPHLIQTEGARIVTVTVDTGGFTSNELKSIKARALRLGASRHVCIDARKRVWDGFLSTIIQGNCLRGGVYPLSVSAERTAQAMAVVELARQEKAYAVAHGSTGAGNDQVRFDLAFRTLEPSLKIITPIRDLGLSREQERVFLEKQGVKIPAKTTRYSINAGLCGVTIGGGETHDPWLSISEEAFTTTKNPEKASVKGEMVLLSFRNGLPVTLNGRPMDGVNLITRLAEIGGRHGVGRGIHLGDTILGIKGRIAFEAPGPLIAIQAHRELEKLVLTASQQQWKAQVSESYAQMLHAGLYFDPVVRDLESLIQSSQHRVTGDVRILLRRGRILVEGVRSPYSLMARKVATYGEENILWTARDAAGFCKIYGLQGSLASKVGRAGR